MNRKKWLCLTLFLCSALAFHGTAAARNRILSAAAVAEVAGDGEHVSNVILQYDAPIRGDSVSPADYTAKGRTVDKAYANTAGTPTDRPAAAGNYVILHLKALPMTDSSVDPHPEDGSMEERKAMGHNGPVLGSHGNPQPLPKMEAAVRQVGLVKTSAGRIYGPSDTITATKIIEPVVEDFKQGVFKDPAQKGAALQYNLYIPKPYDPAKTYPLVLFMHDAGCVSPEIKTTLVQGLGAVTFASPAWQAEHPSFVLAPQYDTVIVDDNYQYGPELDRTIHLVQQLCSAYSIDTRRIYNTGQSMGGMTSIAMDVKYPDFFAGSYIIAAKWNEAVTSPLGRQHIWAVTSEGDPGASPSLEKIMDNLAKDGVTVARQTLDTSRPMTEVNAQAAALIQPSCSHYLTRYKGGSHRSTWQYAYSMTPALEWLFAQHK